MAKNIGSFQGVKSDGILFEAVPDVYPDTTRLAMGGQVRTFDGARRVGKFVAERVGNCPTSLAFSHGDVEVIDAKHHVVRSALPHLVPLLSADEVRLLQLFGVDVARLVSKLRSA